MSKCLHIAAYLRISVDDGRDNESMSIANQRQLVRTYVAERAEFEGAAFTEYIDDGTSGSHSDRDAYKRLLADVERGIVQCIICKDLSRIGRNMLDVDDLLMNHLVTLNVRFIAINNGYDSFSSPLSNLELAIINLTNQHYSKDLAVKSMTAKNVKSKRGEYLAQAPFGYKKLSKNALIPDEEAAEYVRLIYSLACEGRKTVEIARILNDQGIPSPSVYKSRNGWANIWKNRIDSDYCFWTEGVVQKLIKNEVYMGTLTANKRKVIETGTSRSKARPREEWIIVPNAHEALVSEEDFKKAQIILQKKKYPNKPEHLFGNKVKCPACGHAMTRYTKNNPRFKCGTAKTTDHYGCKTYTILQSDIEKVVLASIQAYAAVLLDDEEMNLARIQKSKLSLKSLESEITAAQKAIDSLETSITNAYTAHMNGKITMDAFRRKKEAVNSTIAINREEIARRSAQIQSLTTELTDTEATIAQLRGLQSIKALDCEMVCLLIDKILVHGEDDIEIVWNGIFDARDKARNSGQMC